MKHSRQLITGFTMDSLNASISCYLSYIASIRGGELSHGTVSTFKDIYINYGQEHDKASVTKRRNINNFLIINHT